MLVTVVGVGVVVDEVTGDVETVIEPFTVCVTVPFDAYTANEYVPPASLVGVPDNSQIVPPLFVNKTPGGILSTPRAVVCPIISYETDSIGNPINADWLSGPETFVTEIEPEGLEVLVFEPVFWEVVVFVLVVVVGVDGVVVVGVDGVVVVGVVGVDGDVVVGVVVVVVGVVVHESILTLKDADSLSPVYPLTADIWTWYDPKELSIGVPLILIAIWAFPFKSLGWFSIL